jgi:hypothetical protein
LLKAEVEKWKNFGYLMAQSYDELKTKHESVTQERDKERKIVGALREQVDTLKEIMQAREE